MCPYAHQHGSGARTTTTRAQATTQARKTQSLVLPYGTRCLKHDKHESRQQNPNPPHEVRIPSTQQSHPTTHLSTVTRLISKLRNAHSTVDHVPWFSGTAVSSCTLARTISTFGAGDQVSCSSTRVMKPREIMPRMHSMATSF